MFYRVTAATLIMSMPLINSNLWLEGIKTPPLTTELSSEEMRETIPVTPRTSTILFAMSNYDTRNAKAFVEIVYRESRFDPTATNPETGAYGLGQALPPEKMDSVAPDWRHNIQTQLEWTKRYIEERYGSPLEALAHHDDYGWY